MENKVKLFFGFIDERHRIWARRAAGQPYPWTKDPVLKHYKFTNVYRELDKGTVQLWEMVQRDCLGLKETVYSVVAYRMINRYEWFQEHGLVTMDQNLAQVGKKMRDYKKEHGAVFSGAYRVLCNVPAGTERVDGFIKSMVWLRKHLRQVTNSIRSARDLMELTEAFMIIPHVGWFLAYEIATDIINLDPQLQRVYSEDDWANIGPGAIRGLEYIYGQKPKDQLEALEMARTLRAQQQQYLPKDYPGKPLTLRNIEHSLCEFGKYMNIKNKRGRSRPIYYPPV